MPCLALVLMAAGGKNKPATEVDDASLTQAVQIKLSSDTSLGGEPIQSAVQQGVAILTGSVSTAAAHSLAANDVVQVAGIRTLVNNLSIHPSAAVASVLTPPPSRIRPEKPAHHLTPPAEDPACRRRPCQCKRHKPLHHLRPSSENCQRFPRPLLRSASPTVHSISLASGTILPVRITETLDSAVTQEGDTFSGVLASDVVSDDLVVLPQGTPVRGRVTAFQESAHFKGSSLLTIELTNLDRKGDHLPITTDSFSKAGNGRGKNSAEKIGGGAAVGAILGGILGGGKGATIGAAAGGGAGTGVQAVTKGQQVQIESETVVRFQLSNPIEVKVATGNRSRKAQSNPDLQRHQ